MYVNVSLFFFSWFGHYISSRALLKSQAIAIIMIAFITINRKVNKKPNSVLEGTSETRFSLSDNQFLNE